MEIDLYLKGYRNVTIDIFYYMPDHRSLIQEFIWQTTDLMPYYPKVHKFLNYWRTDIDAVIKDIILIEQTLTNYKNVRWHYVY